MTRLTRCWIGLYKILKAMDKREILRQLLSGNFGSPAEARRALGIERRAVLIDRGHPEQVELDTDGQPRQPVGRADIPLVFDRYDHVVTIHVIGACPPVTREEDLPDPD